MANTPSSLHQIAPKNREFLTAIRANKYMLPHIPPSICACRKQRALSCSCVLRIINIETATQTHKRLTGAARRCAHLICIPSLRRTTPTYTTYYIHLCGAAVSVTNPASCQSACIQTRAHAQSMRIVYLFCSNVCVSLCVCVTCELRPFEPHRAFPPSSGRQPPPRTPRPTGKTTRTSPRASPLSIHL